MSTFIEPRNEPLAEFRLGTDGKMRLIAKRTGLSSASVLKSGAVAIPSIPVPEVRTATRFAGTGTAANYLAADLAISNPGNITADDGSFATVTLSAANQNSQMHYATNFGHTVPTGAQITGLTAKIRALLDGGTAGTWTLTNLYLVVEGELTGIDLFNVAVAPTTSEAEYTIDLTNCGVPLTAEMINDSGFGIAMRWNHSIGTTPRTLQVDSVALEVDYTSNVFLDASPTARFTLATIPTDSTEISSVKFPAPGQTPNAALFFQAMIDSGSYGTNGQTNPITRPNGKFAMAMTDGTTTVYTSSNEDDNTSLSSSRWLRSTGIIAEGRTALSDPISFDSFGAGFVQVDWVDVDFRRPVLAVPLQFAEREVIIKNGVDPATTPTEDFDTTFPPDGVFYLSGLEITPSGSHGSYLGWGIGCAVRSGAGFNQAGLTVEQINMRIGVTTSEFENRVMLDPAAIHTHHDPGPSSGITFANYRWLIDAFNADGFTVAYEGDNSADAGGDDGGFFMPFKLNPGEQIACGVLTMPTTTGTITLDAADFDPVIPFTPKFLLLGMCLAEGTGAWEGVSSVGDIPAGTEGNGDAFGIAVLSADGRAVSMGQCNQSGVGTSNVMQFIRRDGIELRNGDQSINFSATLEAFVAGGVRLDVATADATARKWFFMAIG